MSIDPSQFSNEVIAPDRNELARLYKAAENDPALFEKLRQIIDGENGEPVPPEAFSWPPRIVVLDSRREPGQPCRICNGFETVTAAYVRPCGPAHLVHYQGEDLIAHDAADAWKRAAPYGQEEGSAEEDGEA